MRGKLRRFSAELRKPPNVVIAISLIVFIFIWGSNWQGHSELFDRKWWFDTLGHALFGFGGALSLRYLIRKYAAKGFFVFDEGRRFLATVVEAWIMKLAIFWEVLEFGWDSWGQPYLTWLARAQKDLVDTMLDIIATVAAAKIALLLAYWYDRWYEERYPDESAEVDEDEVIGMLSRVSSSKSHRRRAHRRQRIERVIGFLKDELDKIGDKFKDDKDGEN